MSVAASCKNFQQHIIAGNRAYSKDLIAISFIQCGDFFSGVFCRPRHSRRRRLQAPLSAYPKGRPLLPSRSRILKTSGSKLV